MEAEPGEVGGEAAFRAADAKVRHQGDAEPAADRGAVDRADYRLAGPEQAHRFDVKVVAAARIFRRPAAVAEIGPGAKRLTLRAQHDGTNARILVEGLERIGDLFDQRIVEIVEWRALDFDGSDEIVDGDFDVVIRAIAGHVIPNPSFIFLGGTPALCGCL